MRAVLLSIVSVGIMSLGHIKSQVGLMAQVGCLIVWLFYWFACEPPRQRVAPGVHSQVYWFGKSLVWALLFSSIFFSLQQLWLKPLPWTDLHQWMMRPWAFSWLCCLCFARIWHITTHDSMHTHETYAVQTFWHVMRLSLAVLGLMLGLHQGFILGVILLNAGFFMPVYWEDTKGSLWQRAEPMVLSFLLLLQAFALLVLLRSWFMHLPLSWLVLNVLFLWGYLIFFWFPGISMMQHWVRGLNVCLLCLLAGYAYWHGFVTIQGHTCFFMLMQGLDHYIIWLPLVLVGGLLGVKLLLLKEYLHRPVRWLDAQTFILIWLVVAMMLIFHPSVKRSWALNRVPSCLHLPMAQAKNIGLQPQQLALLHERLAMTQRELSLFEAGMAWLSPFQIQAWMAPSRICRMHSKQQLLLGMVNQSGDCQSLLGDDIESDMDRFQVLVVGHSSHLLWWPSQIKMPSHLGMLQRPRLSMLVAAHQHGQFVGVCMANDGKQWRLGQWQQHACCLGQKNGTMFGIRSAFILLVLSDISRQGV